MSLLFVVLFLSLLALVLGGSALVYVVNVTGDIRATQLDGTPLGKQLLKSTEDTGTTLTLLQDCLDPEGDCGKRGAANQDQALKEIREYTFIVNYCIDKPGHQTVHQIKTCYHRYERGHRKTPQP